MYSCRSFLTTLSVIVSFISFGAENSVSASNGPEASHVIRGIRSRDTRSLRARSSDYLRDKPDLLSARSLNKRQGRTMGGGAGGAGGAGGSGRGEEIMKSVIDRVAAGLAATIAKYSALKEANLALPTEAEVSEAMSQASQNVDSGQLSAVLRAFKSGLDGLADKKLADGGKSGGAEISSKEKRQMRGGAGGRSPTPTGGARGTTSTPNAGASGASTSGPVSKDMIDGIASAFLDMVTKFAEAKASGGRLPTGEEISQTLQEVVKNGDIKNRMETALSAVKAMNSLAEKMKTAK
ncbi:hypothetical protein DFH28DRAFT_1159708 [Melampsora americana]|nr:hypothetical protein DFH28DRAFT_1159708 [Melampsora americana]